MSDWRQFALIGVIVAAGCGKGVAGGGDSVSAAGSSSTGTAGGSAAGGSAIGDSSSGSSAGGGSTSGVGGLTTGGAGGMGGVGGAAGEGGATPIAGGAGGSGDSAGGGGTGGSGGDADAGGGSVRPALITSPWPSSGCGVDPPAETADDLHFYMIQTSGTKAADCADMSCDPWMSNREYSIHLPQGYNKENPYPLVFEGPGCGGNSNNVFNYSSDNTTLSANASDTVIRIGIRPSQEIQAVHATNPNQGCFDDHEGDDSADFVLYETLYDLLETQLCFDRNRVFAGGVSSGATLANELGCKYAGDLTHPIRGVLPTLGDFPDQTKYRPTCTANGMAGIWISEVGDPTHPFSGVVSALNRAMTVDGCPPGTTYDTAQWESFPIGGGVADDTCKRILGCDPVYPLVVCPLPGNGKSSHEQQANPGGATFMRSFLAPPLITP